MAEAIGLAASVIAVIDLSAKVATLCFQYSTAVGNARADVAHLQSRLNDLDACLRGVHRVLHGPNNQALPISRELIDSLDSCKSELAQVQNRLDPGKARKTMRRLGLRALKWPFDSKEVSGIVANLERYKQTIMLCLQVDQTCVSAPLESPTEQADAIAVQSCLISNKSSTVSRSNPAEIDQLPAYPASTSHSTKTPTSSIDRILRHGFRVNTRVLQVA
jgi:hypothetical protein